MATLTLHQKRINEAGGTYKVENTVTVSDGIPTEIFVLKNNSGEFSHVANVWELTELPTEESVDYSFYRSEYAEATYTDIAGAIRFAEDLKRRVDILIDEYTPEVDAFPGEEDTNFPIPD